MTTLIDFVITIRVGDNVKTINTCCDLMTIGQSVRGRTRNLFNNALRRAGRDVQVAADFYGQMKHEPYTTYSGELGGVNGRLLRKKGTYE